MEAPTSATIERCESKFPYAIVWGPLGPLTCCCPCVGHMGIADSQGKIHDFQGPYSIGIDEFMVGCVLRYAVVSGPGDEGWDAVRVSLPRCVVSCGSPLRVRRRALPQAIERADSVYAQRIHDICCDNCHHHTALALNESGKTCLGRPHSLLSAWFYVCLMGRCVCC